MHLTQLEVTDFRNIPSLSLQPDRHFNIICGENGSGKTSILEAIYFLGLARSFRAQHTKTLIHHGAIACAVFAHIDNQGIQVSAGIEKRFHGKLLIKANGVMANSAAELAALLPMQLLNQNSFNLLEGGLKYRRQFLDWGVFHVEPSFYPLWKRMQRAVSQRNAALKQAIANEQICLWDKELQEVGVAIAKMRRDYLAHFTPIFLQLAKDLLGNAYEFSMNFSPGWDDNNTLERVLQLALPRDKSLGYTQYGPHRADWRLLIDRRDRHFSTQDILSRGEQKMVVCALKLAQATILQTITGKQGLFLIDDLPAELDPRHRRHILQSLRQLKSQVFMTSVSLSDVADMLAEKDSRVFHVKQGQICSE
jgi:DNA replication and repair protein RecF